MVRVSLDYLNPMKFGVWLTISSLLGWFSFFDIGLGNGLKNKLSEALAKKDYVLGKIYVSTTYAVLAAIVAITALLFFLANPLLDWTKILNTERGMLPEVEMLVLVVFCFFFIRFVLQILSIVLQAYQRPALANSLGTLGNMMALIIIFILTKTTSGSLIYLGLSLSAMPVLVLFLAAVYFYRHDLKLVAPSWRHVELTRAKDLASLGAKFFFIQIASLIIYQSSNIIISSFFGPAEVTTYNIAYKYYSFSYLVFVIVLTPFWPAFTDAWAKNDVTWIQKMVEKLMMVWGVFSILSAFMLLISNWAFHVWIGDQVIIPFGLSLGLLIYFITFALGNIFTTFINGIGKVKLQMYSSFMMVVIFIVMVLVLIKVFNFGIMSVVIGSIFANLYGITMGPIQFIKITRNQATGIWNE
jgi:O-antigen/teichoic acid export membrane protein